MFIINNYVMVIFPIFICHFLGKGLTLRFSYGSINFVRVELDNS